MTSLNDYEAEQVREIAWWKSERPSLILESFRGISRPFARLLAVVVPVGLAHKALDEVEALAGKHDSIGDILGAGGVSAVGDLLGKPLEECDLLARMVGVRSEHHALLEGFVPAVGGVAIPGAGGALASVADIPFLLQASLRSIRRIGHCYGFALDSEADHKFVLAILAIAHNDRPAGSEEERHSLWAIEVAKSQDDQTTSEIEGAVADDLPLEVVPFVGDVANLVLDYAFVRRVDVTARRVFQERWLRANHKLDSIAPAAEIHRRSSIEGVVDVTSELAYAGAYGVAFGATFPAILAGNAVSSIAPDVVLRGFREGASAAVRDSKEFLEGFGRTAEPSAKIGSGLAPSGV